MPVPELSNITAQIQTLIQAAYDEGVEEGIKLERARVQRLIADAPPEPVETVPAVNTQTINVPLLDMGKGETPVANPKSDVPAERWPTLVNATVPMHAIIADARVTELLRGKGVRNTGDFTELSNVSELQVKHLGSVRFPQFLQNLDELEAAAEQKAH